MELDNRPLVTYLIRQKKTVEYLLSKKNERYFSKMYPIFYKNRDGNSAIDIALRNNLMRPISLVINYIVEYQNSPVFCDLFYNNLLKLLPLSVPLTHVFESQIFLTTIDHSSWPS